MKKKFNLSDWALDHAQLVWYFMIVFALAGAISFVKLGREEDPNFTIKTMVIQVQWPGSAVDDMTRQVSDRIEKKLQELSSLDFTRAMIRPGTATIFVNLRADTKARDVAATWTKIRAMIGDISGEFPQGVVGPFFNDTFGDVFGNVYAFTSDGLTKRQLRDYVEDARSKVLTVPDVGRVEVIGAEDEVIYLEFSPRQLAQFGVNQQAVIQTLQQQNSVTPSGVIQAGAERVAIRVSGQFTSEESLKSINLRVNGRFFRLSDVATITRDYADPPSTLFRFNGEPAIGLAIGMKQGANLLEFGEALRAEMTRVEAELPIGVGVHLVSDQPALVDEAVGHFTRALFEAVVIVLAVSFISLGMRAGVVVALAIPLVLAITFVVMEYSGISLQRISLGALIIALGLLVDDAMIAVEMMVARLEAGDSLRKAATSVYTSTAFPMLTGTLVTVAGFIPIGLNNSAAGEFTFTMFVVIAVSLIVSWIVAVIFTPLLGVEILPSTLKSHHGHKGWFSSFFSGLLQLCLTWRWATIALTVATFCASIYGMRFVPEQFFPSSDRQELIIDWNLPHNASIRETSVQMARFEKEVLTGNTDVVRWSSYVGQGAVRFLLSFDVEPNSPAFGQMVIISKDLEARSRLKKTFEVYLRQTFPNTDALVKLLEIGPPVGRPVVYRIGGPDVQKVRQLAQDLARAMSVNPHIGVPVLEWNEPSRVVRVDVLQDKARQLGVTSQDVAQALNGIVGGSTITALRDDIYQIQVIGRAVAEERNSVEALRDLQLAGQNGQAVPLGAIANLRYEIEQPQIWTRNRVPTLAVKASIIDDAQAATINTQLQPTIDAFGRTLPAGYHVATAGSAEESAKSQAPIIAVVPLMLFVMATVLMLQLQNFSQLVLVFAVAPLALVGVVAALLPSQAPLGFVAILGVLALIGILIRNSVILVVQIEDLKREGVPPWDAVVQATEGRMRPILLTAAAASLSLIPIAPQIFWGPMAYAMMGGIIVGTVLTLLFLPALYVTWFRVRPDTRPEPQPGADDLEEAT